MLKKIRKKIKMTKKLLSILLMGSFTTFATDLNINDNNNQIEQKQASKLNGLEEYKDTLDHINSAILLDHKDDSSLFNKIQEGVDFSDKVKQENLEQQEIERQKDLKEKKKEKRRASKEALKKNKIKKQEKEKKRKEKYKQKAQFRLKTSHQLEDNNQTQEATKLTINFFNKKMEQNFKKLKATNHKIHDLIADIEMDPWSLKGIGKPERLKYKKNHYSRRIDHENRLEYIVDGPSSITIMACEGHYN